MSKIEWTEKTWNPVTGCTKMSEACENCYAEVMAIRLSGMPASKEKYHNGFKLTLHPEALEEPLKWKKPQMVFVVSMGDLFKNNPPRRVWVSSSRLKCAMNGDFDSMGSSATAYAWFVWEKGFKGSPEIRWFN